jgi:hypothetical protein
MAGKTDYCITTAALRRVIEALSLLSVVSGTRPRKYDGLHVATN